ncbi:MAG: hypothetical protein AB8F74_12415 [Saprospiraceae bacterium]
MLFYTLFLSFLMLQVDEPVMIDEPVDLSGFWSGVTTQDGEINEDGEKEEITYDIQLHLQDKNGKVSGTSIISGHEIHATIEVEGTFEAGMSLLLKDTEIKDNIVKQDVQMEWCLKNYILLLKKENEELILEGHWHGKTSFMDCTPGRVVLKRGEERA